MYIVAFEDMGDREGAWTAFRNNPEWRRIKAESEADGALVSKFTNTLLVPTDYSPLHIATRAFDSI